MVNDERHLFAAASVSWIPDFTAGEKYEPDLCWCPVVSLLLLFFVWSCSSCQGQTLTDCTDAVLSHGPSVSSHL